ncbi:ATP synthase subunit I [Candidatus Aminicenantes bacterium AC-335-L06]|nr:ATP synthase subunit I [Candidatus Aminicenantes bacterium AC-335-L06]
MITEKRQFTEEEYQILRKIPRTTIIISFIFSIIGLIFFSLMTSIIILLGGILSILNFLWLKKSIIKLTSFEKKKALINGLILYFIRFLLIFISFFIIIKISSENILGFAVVFFSIFFAMTIEFILNVKEK